jgi:hypothetical protein
MKTMTNPNPENQKLEERVKKLEDSKGKKDIWDILGILTSFLIPLSIFFAGYFLSESERRAKLSQQEKEIQLAEIKSKVDQAQLVSIFLEALVDTNAYKRQLAIKSILLALPEKGEEIVKTISENDPNESVKKYAEQSLIENRNKRIREELIQQIFDKNKQTRLSATNQLIQNWNNNEMIVNGLIEYASKRLDNAPENMSGIINTIVVLNNVEAPLLKNNAERVLNFIEMIEGLEERKQTQEYLETLKKRF